MDGTIDPASLQGLTTEIWAWIEVHVLTMASLWQAVATLVALGLALTFAPLSRRLASRLIVKPPAWAARTGAVVAPLAVPILWLVLQSATVAAPAAAFGDKRMMTAVASLLVAWVVIRIAASFIRDKVWARTLATVIWGLAALDILGLLDPLVAALEGLAFTAGEFRISAFGAIKGLVLVALFLWLANVVSRLAEKRIGHLVTLTPSAQVLTGKVLRFALYVGAILVTLQSIGIDLTALAVFSGALGLGAGFGLQKVVANLVSGVILLMDKSVKPGDVIAIEGTYGWINKLSARYVSVITRDSTEYLIPNEQLISQQVENWSYTSNNVRLKLPIGISYDSDPRQAIELCLEAAGRHERVLSDPPVRCLMRGFGDSAVDLELRVWIADPQNGVRNVMSDLYLAVWDAFHEHGVGIPYPQRDVHLKQDRPLEVKIKD